MREYINEKPMDFENCISRKVAFRWFAVTIVGLMVRSDNLGATSIIRALGIAPHFYENLIHFFHTASRELDGIILFLDEG